MLRAQVTSTKRFFVQVLVAGDAPRSKAKKIQSRMAEVASLRMPEENLQVTVMAMAKNLATMA